MATARVPFSVTGGNRHLKSCDVLSPNSGAFIKKRQLTLQKTKLTLQKTSRSYANHTLSVNANYNDRGSGSGADFVAGFVLGGAIFGTLAYVFAPQIRRSVLNEDEYGFRRTKKPIYYDEGLEVQKTRQTLNEKISQLNSAIDRVSSRLRGGNKRAPQVPAEADAEESTL